VSRGLVALAALLWAGAVGAADDCAAMLKAPHALHADGDGYFIREGIVIVPKNGVIRNGTVI